MKNKQKKIKARVSFLRLLNKYTINTSSMLYHSRLSSRVQKEEMIPKKIPAFVELYLRRKMCIKSHMKYN